VGSRAHRILKGRVLIALPPVLRVRALAGPVAAADSAGPAEEDLALPGQAAGAAADRDLPPAGVGAAGEEDNRA